MSREETIELGLDKTLAILAKMRETEYSNDVVKNVKITSSLSLEINGIVGELEGTGCVAKPFCFEVYAIKKGVAVDCMTLDIHRNFGADIFFLLNCYV